MRQRRLVKKSCSLILIAVMLLTAVVPALAAEQDTGVSFRQVENGAVTASLLDAPETKAETENEEEPEYEATDSVRVSIVLNGQSTIEMGYSVQNIAENSRAMNYRQALRSRQETVTENIEGRLGETLDVQWNLTLAANIISANVTYGDIEAIEQVAGVEQVVVETRYDAIETVEEETAEPQMTISTGMTGMSNAWEAGYTGAGTRIAIIDTGLDTDHQSFGEAGYLHALEENAKMKNIGYAEYVDSLDLLDMGEWADKLYLLNANGKAPGTTAADYIYSQKIPFKFNYVDSTADYVTHEKDTQTDHGSHVAGIAAANRYIQQGDNFVSALETVDVVGNAPDAQLLVMKVFGELGGAYTSDYMAAIEDAIMLGADTINLSLGTAANGFSDAGVYEYLMEKLESAGAVVAMAAGNEGAWPTMANTNNPLDSGYLYTDDVMYDRMGSPASYTNAMAVASVDNHGQISDSSLSVSKDGTTMSAVYNETQYSNQPFAGLDITEDRSGTEYGYVMINGYGEAGDLNGIDVKEKIVIISRGNGIAFYEKANYAVSCGAAATIIYNNVSGTLGMDLTDYSYTNPCVSITQDVANRIRELSESCTTEDNRVYYAGTMTIKNSRSRSEDTRDYYTMSDFSSWGSTGDLALKPEVTAPGGSIYSVRGDSAATNLYKTNSGTSMASPQVAGVAAVAQQYIREMNLTGAFEHTKRQLAQSLLMSTATPLKDGDGNYYSILQQGAGLVNGAGIVSAGTYIMMNEGSTPSYADGKVKAELGDDPERDGIYNISFTIYNPTDTNMTYSMSADVFTQDVFEAPSNAGASTMAHYSKLSTKSLDSITLFEENDVVKTDGKIAVPAKGSVKVEARIQITDTGKNWLAKYYPRGTYIQAYIFAKPAATGEGEIAATHSIPVLAFYGNWTDPSMFDGPSYQDGEIVSIYSTPETTDQSRLPYRIVYPTTDGAEYGQNNLVVTTADGKQYIYGGNPLVPDGSYHEERNALSGSLYVYGFHFVPMRDAAWIGYQIRNMTTGEVYQEMGMETEQTGIYYSKSSGAWQGGQYLHYVGYQLPEVPEDQVVEFIMTRLPEYYSEGKLGYGKTPGEGASVKVTTKIDSTAPVVDQIVCQDDGTLDVTAYDANYVAAVVLYNKDGTEVVSYTGSKEEIEPGERAVYTVDTAGSGETAYMLQIFDYAMNPATYYMEIDGTEVTYSGSILAYDLDQTTWVQLSKRSDAIPAVSGETRTYTAATSVGDVIYAVAYGNELYKLSVSDTETPEYLAQLPFNPVDLAYSTKDGLLYAVTDESELACIHPTNGGYRVFGSTPIQTNTLACDENGVFYSNQYGTGKIYAYTLDSMKTVNLSYDFDGDGVLNEADCQALLDYVTGKRTSIEKAAYADLDQDGDVDTYDVYRALDKVPDRVTLIAEIGIASKYMQAMEIDPNDGTLYWATYCTEQIREQEIGFSVLYGFDIETGTHVRYADVWDQMSCLLVLDKHAGSIFEPAEGSTGLDGAEDKRYTGKTEESAIASAWGVDNSLKAEYLAEKPVEKTITVTLQADERTTNGKYRVEYDTETMTLRSAVGMGELNSFVEAAGEVTFGYAGKSVMLEQEPLAELTFVTTSCEASAVIHVEEFNQTKPGTETVTDAGAHKWGQWSEEETASCGKDGLRSRMCSVCKTIETEVIPADRDSHQWSEWAVVKKATANEPGIDTRSCGECGTVQRQWTLTDGMVMTAVDANAGVFQVNEDCIGEVKVTLAGTEQVWRLTTADGSIRYLVELSGTTASDACLRVDLTQYEANAAGHGSAIRREKVESVGWEDNELDYTVDLEGGIGSMTAYSYYNSSQYTELGVHFMIGEEGSTTGDVMYIQTPAQGEGHGDQFLSRIGVWEAEVLKYYWLTDEMEGSGEDKKTYTYTAHIWVAPELADDAELELEFKDAASVYLCDDSGADTGSNLKDTGLKVKLENGTATVKLLQKGRLPYNPDRYFILHFRNDVNQAPKLVDSASGTVSAVKNYTKLIDLSTLFEDPNGDQLRYTVSVNGGEAQEAQEQYVLAPDTPGTITLVFTASDGFLNCESAYTMTVHVTENLILGDLDMDGDADQRDAALLRRHLAKWKVDGICVEAGDVNGDQTVNLLDYVILRRYVSGWEGVILGPTG